MSLRNFSRLSTPQNQEKKQIARHEVHSPIKINHYAMAMAIAMALGLACLWNTRKILMSDPETALTTPCLLSLRWSRRLYGNYLSSKSSGSSRNVFNNCGDQDNSDYHMETRLDWIRVRLVLCHSQPVARMHGFIHVDYFCKEKYDTARSLAEIVNGWLSVLLTTHRLIIYFDSSQCKITLGTTLLNCGG